MVRDGGLHRVWKFHVCEIAQEKFNIILAQSHSAWHAQEEEGNHPRHCIHTKHRI